MAARDIDKHLIGRHDQEDHDPTKKKSRADVDARNKAMGLEYGDHGSLLYDDLDPNDKRHSRNAHDKTLQRVTAGVGGVAGYALAGPTGAVLGAGVGAGVGSRAGMRNQRGALPPGTRLNYVDKHLIGRHDQGDHDPNKEERDHSRKDHEDTERVRLKFGDSLGETMSPAQSAAIGMLIYGLLGTRHNALNQLVGSVGGAATGYQLAGGQLFGNPGGSTAGGIAAGVGNTVVDPLGTAVRRALYGDPNEQALSSRDKEELKLSKRAEGITMSTRIGFLLSKAREHSNSEDELHDNIADLVDSVEKMIIAKSNLPEEVSKQTVTVEEYTRSDGTVVPRHERKISGRALAAVAGAAGAAALASPLGRPLRSGFAAGRSAPGMANASGPGAFGRLDSLRTLTPGRAAPGTRAGIEMGNQVGRGQAAASRATAPARSSAASGWNFGRLHGPVSGSGSRVTDLASSVGAGVTRARDVARTAGSNARQLPGNARQAGSNARLGFDMGRRSGESFTTGTRATNLGSRAGSAPGRAGQAARDSRQVPGDFRSGLQRAGSGNPSRAYRAGSRGRSAFDAAGAQGRAVAGATQEAAQRAGRYVGEGGALGQAVGGVPWQTQAAVGAGAAAVGGGGYYARERTRKSLSESEMAILEKYLGR